MHTLNHNSIYIYECKYMYVSIYKYIILIIEYTVLLLINILYYEIIIQYMYNYDLIYIL